MMTLIDVYACMSNQHVVSVVLLMRIPPVIGLMVLEIQFENAPYLTKNSDVYKMSYFNSIFNRGKSLTNTLRFSLPIYNLLFANFLKVFLYFCEINALCLVFLSGIL